GARQPHVIRREAHAGDDVRVRIEDLAQVAARQVPQLDLAADEALALVVPEHLAAGAGQPGAVGAEGDGGGQPVVALEQTRLAAALHVPHLDLALAEAALGIPDAAGRGQQLAAGTEGDRVDRAAVAVEGVDLLVGGDVPEDDLARLPQLAARRGGQVLAVAAEGDAAYRQAVAGQRELLLAGLRVPDHDGGARRLAVAAV